MKHADELMVIRKMLYKCRSFGCLLPKKQEGGVEPPSSWKDVCNGFREATIAFLLLSINPLLSLLMSNMVEMRNI